MESSSDRDVGFGPEFEEHLCEDYIEAALAVLDTSLKRSPEYREDRWTSALAQVIDSLEIHRIHEIYGDPWNAEIAELNLPNMLTHVKSSNRPPDTQGYTFDLATKCITKLLRFPNDMDSLLEDATLDWQIQSLRNLEDFRQNQGHQHFRFLNYYVPYQDRLDMPECARPWLNLFEMSEVTAKVLARNISYKEDESSWGILDRFISRYARYAAGALERAQQELLTRVAQGGYVESTVLTVLAGTMRQH